jgi:hypothetical protein
MNFKINSAPAGLFDEKESVIKLSDAFKMLEEIKRLEQLVKNNVAFGDVRQQSELLTDFMEMIECTEMVFLNKPKLLDKFKNRQ